MNKKYKLVKSINHKRIYGTTIRMIISIVVTLALIYGSLEKNGFADFTENMHLPVPIVMVLVFLVSSITLHALLLAIYEFGVLILSKCDGFLLKILACGAFITLLIIIIPTFSKIINSNAMLYFIFVVFVVAMVLYDILGSFFRLQVFTSVSSIENNINNTQRGKTDDFIDKLINKDNNDDSH